MPANKKQLLNLLKKAEKAYQDFEFAVEQFNTVLSQARIKVSEIRDKKKLEQIRNTLK